ncbi:MAG: hypothetical protein RQ736_01390 [Thiogranum sp.]|nr:hypothetical protein [Thiogranum sp.]
MGFILDMASGKNLTQQSRQTVDQEGIALHEPAPTALQAPSARLVTAGVSAPTTRAMPHINIEALIQSIED